MNKKNWVTPYLEIESISDITHGLGQGKEAGVTDNQFVGLNVQDS